MTPTARRSGSLAGIILSLFLAVTHRAPAEAADPAFALLATLGGRPTAPNLPGAGLVAVNGRLYGTTRGGGAYNGGAVIEIAPVRQLGTSSKARTICSFGASATDGTGPDGDLAVDATGALYGTTETGGTGYGTVFRLTPPTPSGTSWTETQLLAFSGADGANPVGSVTIGADGSLYGTASRGGNPGCNLAGCGSVWRLSPPAGGATAWTEQVLILFTGGGDGATPTSPPVFQGNTVFGTTQFGGSGGAGVVYGLTPPTDSGSAWTESVLHAFTGAPDGSGPVASLAFDAHGNAYGTTLIGGLASCAANPAGIGCGTVFELAPPAVPGGAWVESILYSFAGTTDGVDAASSLRFGPNGTLFGTTLGNSDTLYGSIFRLTPPSVAGRPFVQTTLYTFTDGADGVEPRNLV